MDRRFEPVERPVAGCSGEQDDPVELLGHVLSDLPGHEGAGTSLHNL